MARHESKAGRVRVWGGAAVLTALVTAGLGLARAEGPATDVARTAPALSPAASAWLASRPKRDVKPPALTPAGLDALVDRYVKDAKGAPSVRTTDPEFVRRVFLDVVGKPPTPAEARAFVNDPAADKRAKLIDRLLASPDHAANWARYWSDVIRYHATNQNLGRVGFRELETWLAGAIAANRPWDEVASELIAATGRADENGAVAFTLAHEGQAVEVAGEVARVFLGVQIQCAQCHDHPTDSWKRQQFHEFAAFFAGTRVRRANPAKERPPVFEVVARGKPRYTMPDLHDPAKAIAVVPRFFLTPDTASAGETPPAVPEGLTAADRRRLAAAYVTGPDNPWFARAYVNRVWFALLGEGFYSPVDDLGPDREAKAPEVLAALADAWRDGGYDARWLFRTVLNSRAYQRAARGPNTGPGQTPFAANAPARLRADQILDSLATVLDLPLDGKRDQAGAGAPKKKALAVELKAAAGKAKGQGGPRAFTPRVAFNAVFGVDPSLSADEVLGTIPQALFLMNSPALQRFMEARPGTVLGGILTTYPDNRAALNALYVRVLAREPTAKEARACGEYLRTVGDRREAFEDILWGLLNSTEFVSRR